jgi:hypothetical protein
MGNDEKGLIGDNSAIYAYGHGVSCAYLSWHILSGGKPPALQQNHLAVVMRGHLFAVAVITPGHLIIHFNVAVTFLSYLIRSTDRD